MYYKKDIESDRENKKNNKKINSHKNNQKTSPGKNILKLQISHGNQKISSLLSSRNRGFNKSFSYNRLEQEADTMSKSLNSSSGNNKTVNRNLRKHSGEIPSNIRSSYETKTGFDLGDVKIHKGANANKYAKKLNARAFTVGKDIYFGKNQYSPNTGKGRQLLGHELTHVIQQTGNTNKSRSSDANISQSGNIPIQCSYFIKKDLKKYLAYITKNGKIENNSDSDNKAIALVNWWEDAYSGIDLDARLKSILILEMIAGFTGDEEEQAILELLERSSNKELTHIFSTGGVTVNELDSNFHGVEFSWLKEFFNRRFKEGWDGAKKGNLSPQGKAIPRKLPLFAVFPERAEDESGGDQSVKLRRYITSIDIKFDSIKDISSTVWLFAEGIYKKSFKGLTKKEDFKFDAGKAVITFSDGKEETIVVTGGAVKLARYKTHRTGKGFIKIHRKGGATYVNTNGDPMPHASFFHKGQAFHGVGNLNWFLDIFAPFFGLDTPSHGCIHVDNDKMRELYPFIIINKTKVRIQ